MDVEAQILDLHLGIITTLARKSLPKISKVVGVNSAHALHHFVAESPWSVEKFRSRRLERTLEGEHPNSATSTIVRFN